MCWNTTHALSMAARDTLGLKIPKGIVVCCENGHSGGVIFTDFSVVLFRPTFMLFSEKNRMKVHKNQRLLTMPYPLKRLAGATSRGQTMAPEGQKPSKWLSLTKLPREIYSQPIVHKALSWGTIGFAPKVPVAL